jgi:hypothetical protein
MGNHIETRIKCASLDFVSQVGVLTRFLGLVFGLVVEAACRQSHHLAPPPDGDAEASPYPDDLPFFEERLRLF